VAEDPPIDVEALVAELREEAARRRATVGPGSLPPPESREQALAAAGDVAPADHAPSSRGGIAAGLRLGNLGALADPGDVSFHSHRARTGLLVVEAKKLLRRLLTPILDRQAAFNRSAVDAFAALDAAGASRMAELASRVAELERRLPGPPPESEGVGFDARAFADRFRGSSDHVRTAQSAYLRWFPGPESGPVVDLGCGRGEFLDLLRERCIEASGIEADPELVAAGRARGLDVREGDAVAELHLAPDASLGGIVAFQVIEHLPFARLLELLALARRKLRPGGLLLLETVNVQSVFPWTRAWSMDPTHRHPVHPQTLRFLAEQAGFRDVETVFSGPVDDRARLEEGPDLDRETRNARRLNELLFAPQDHALVARA
jgi:O-antigen chain-terminating methyltransferase